jgi:hypothetical protein
MQQLDRDVIEGAAGVGASDVGEVAARVADLAIGHYDTGFGFSLDGVDDVGGAKRNINVRHIMLVEKRGVVRGDAYSEDADVGVFQDKMMMRLVRDGDSDRSLRAEGKCA